MTNVQSETVLVTGGSGLIGSRVVRALVEQGHRAIVFDAVPGASAVSTDQTVFVTGDVNDAIDVLRAIRSHGATSVIHLAAVLTIQASLYPAKAVRTNSEGTANIFEIARSLGLRRVVWTSTAAVYGTRSRYAKMLGRETVTEDDPPAPYDVYGATKYLCESIAGQYRTDGVDAVGLRPVMTFGPGRYNGAVGVLNAAVRDATLHGHGVVYQPWQADLRINPMYVEDAAGLFVAACLSAEPLQRPVYNMGTGEYLSIGEMMDTAANLIGGGATIDFVNEPPSESRGAKVTPFDYADLDSSALRTELNWQPRFDHRAAVADAVRRYREGG